MYFRFLIPENVRILLINNSKNVFVTLSNFVKKGVRWFSDVLGRYPKIDWNCWRIGFRSFMDVTENSRPFNNNSDNMTYCLLVKPSHNINLNAFEIPLNCTTKVSNKLQSITYASHVGLVLTSSNTKWLPKMEEYDEISKVSNFETANNVKVRDFMKILSGFLRVTLDRSCR